MKNVRASFISVFLFISSRFLIVSFLYSLLAHSELQIPTSIPASRNNLNTRSQLSIKLRSDENGKWKFEKMTRWARKNPREKLCQCTSFMIASTVFQTVVCRKDSVAKISAKKRYPLSCKSLFVHRSGIRCRKERGKKNPGPKKIPREVENKKRVSRNSQ